jgi:hypothetical protein
MRRSSAKKAKRPYIAFIIIKTAQNVNRKTDKNARDRETFAPSITFFDHSHQKSARFLCKNQIAKKKSRATTPFSFSNTKKQAPHKCRVLAV